MPTATIVHEQATPALKESPFLLEVQLPDPFTLVIFGATGDLTARKLLPALYGLWHAGFLPEMFAIIGVGRRDKNDDLFREEMRTAIAKVAPRFACGKRRLEGFSRSYILPSRRLYHCRGHEGSRPRTR